MSDLGVPHPTDEQLSAFADGELPPPKMEDIRKHLAACWQCRTELGEIERTIGECIRYRKALETSAPPPPAPWFDIHRHMAALDASGSRRRWSRRALDGLGTLSRSPRRWAPAAVALLLIAIAVRQLRDTPSVRAAELLRKSIAAAESQPRSPRFIQIRTRTQRLTRVVGGSRPVAQTATAADSLAGLESMFRAAHYSWEDPLSAKSFAGWRDQLPDKRDEITTERDLYQLHTTTGSGQLVEATLKLRSPDLRPVEETLQFRNSEWVEISELPDAPALARNAASEAAEAAPATPHHSQPDRLPEPPVSAATPGDELRVLAALHQLGADLGDPVEVTRSGAEVLVSGLGVAPDRRQKILQELRAMPHVRVQFSEPSADALPPQGRSPNQVSASQRISPLQADLEKQLGGRAAFEQFADQVLEKTDAFMSSAYALRRLAERFPADLQAQMTRPDQQLLRSLRRDHTDVLLGSIMEIRERIQPALAALGAPSAGAPVPVPSGSWQEATEQLFGQARRVEDLLTVALGAGGAGENQTQDLPALLLASLAQLQSSTENYRSLTALR